MQSPKTSEGGAPKVIVEVGGDDPDRGRAAKEPNDGFVEMVRAGLGADRRFLTRS